MATDALCGLRTVEVARKYPLQPVTDQAIIVGDQRLSVLIYRESID